MSANAMLPESFRLDGQVAIVTGGGQGIGRASALTLAAAGAAVVCVDLPSGSGAETVALIEKAGGRGRLVLADVTRPEDAQRLADEAFAAFGGRIDILMNNAGGAVFRPFLDIDKAHFTQHFELNAASAFLVTQAVSRYMLEAGRGSVLNVSSGAARFGIRGMASYCVAKAAVEQLTRAMAQELAPKLRVNCVSLGAVRTPAMDSFFVADPQAKRKMEERTPLGRLAEPQDIANAALFLSSPAAAYITGAVLHVDGGLQDTNMPSKLPDL
jgi:NAD(P)-dependent dehydrogenase (short-subunit alcohol dehydrogenase family)